MCRCACDLIFKVVGCAIYHAVVSSCKQLNIAARKSKVEKGCVCGHSEESNTKKNFLKEPQTKLKKRGSSLRFDNSRKHDWCGLVFFGKLFDFCFSS